jgi:DNA-binding CsgD family transcriptional regulator
MGKREGVYLQPKNYVDWDLQPLGIKSDTEIAKVLDVSKATVWRERKRRGIVGVGFSYGKKLSGIDWESFPLGEVSDAEIARSEGISSSSVARERVRRGIKRYVKSKQFLHPRRVSNLERLRFIDWDTQPLGEVTDKVLAKRLGLKESTVYKERRKRKIFVCKGRAVCPCGKEFIVRRDSKFCSKECSRGLWDYLNYHKDVDKDCVSLVLNLQRLKRKIKEKINGVEINK